MAFEYDAAWIDRGLQLSPVALPLRSGKKAMGALTFHPADGPAAASTQIHLDVVAEQSHEVLRGAAVDVLPELVLAGGSPGGARPKVMVGLREDQVMTGHAELAPDQEPWLVKFRGEADHPDSIRMESLILDLAAAAGIDVPDHQLLDAGPIGPALATRRFDRPGPGQRRHAHTVSGLLHVSHRVPSIGYDDLVSLTQTLTGDHRQVVAVRRMVFNVAIHNRDDHTKNTSFLMDTEGAWQLAPAYDLTWSAGPGGEHSMAVNGEGRRPTLADLREVARRGGVRALTARHRGRGEGRTGATAK